MARRRWLDGPAVLLLFACDGDSATGPRGIALADLVGSWELTHWEYSLAGDPSQNADWVALEGLRGSLTIKGNGEFTVTPRLPGGFGQDQGLLTLQGDSLYWDGEDDEEWVHFTLTGRTLALLWPEEETVDMDRDGQPENVRLRVMFESN